MPQIQSHLFYALLALIAGQLIERYYLDTYFDTVTIYIGLSLLSVPFLLIAKRQIAKTIFYYNIIVLGAISSAIHYKLPPNHYSRLPQQKMVRFKITQSLRPNDFAFRYYGKVSGLGTAPSCGKILVTLAKKDHSKPLEIGQHYITSSPLIPVAQPKNPGAFNYARFLKNKSILSQLQLTPNNYSNINKNTWSGWDQIRVWKTRAIKKIHNTSLSQSASAHWVALVFGERQYIENELQTAYKNAGIVHLLAISGLHIGIISFLLNWLLTPLLYWKWGRWLQMILLVFILWGFAILTGMQPAVVRAVTLFTMLFAGQWGKRFQPPLQRVFASAGLLLFWYPPFLYQVGFQLSYLAVIGILLGNELAKKSYVPKKKWKKWVWEFVLVSNSAQLAVTPLTLYYFNQFPSLFLLSNLAVFHLFSISLVAAVGLTPWLLFDWIPAEVLANYNLLVACIHHIVQTIASYESFLWDDIYITKEMVITLYILMLLLFLPWQKKNKIHSRYSWGTIICCVLLLGWHNYKNVKIKNQLWILHQSKKTVILWYEKEIVQLFTDASEAHTQKLMQQFQKIYPVRKIQKDTLWRYLVFDQTKVLIADFDSVLTDTVPPVDIVLLRNNPKIHLNRVINQWRPHTIVADGSNGPWNTERWRESCSAKSISFYTTAEKAFSFIP